MFILPLVGQHVSDKKYNSVGDKWMNGRWSEGDMTVRTPSLHPECRVVLVAERLDEPGESAGDHGQAVRGVFAVESGSTWCMCPCGATMDASDADAAFTAGVSGGVVTPIFVVGFGEQLVPDAIDEDGAFRDLLTPERLDERERGLECGGRLLV